MTTSADRIIGLYSDKAEGWIADRRRTLGTGGPGLTEAGWFERFTAALPPGGTVLDIRCGAGWPVATLQKPQARVQTSPMIMKLACFCSQQPPIFGQAAS